MDNSRWTAVPAARSKAPVLQIRLVIVVGLLLLSSVAGVASAVAWFSAKPAPVAASPVAVAPAFAQTIASDFLSGSTTALPVAQTLSQDFGNQSGKPPLPVSAFYADGFTHSVINGQSIETTAFLVTTVPSDQTTNAPTFILSVPVNVSTPTRPVLAAYPTLQPQPLAASGTTSSIDYTSAAGYTTNVSSAVKTAISAWAIAYAKNDTSGPQGLNVLVGAPQSLNANYVGLGGFTTDPGSITYISATQPPGGNQEVVRAQLVFTSSSANTVKMSNDFDILVGNTGSTNPNVQAWGPAGSGPNLIAYQTNNTNRTGSGG